jgi:hypothetical protein
MSNLFGAIDDQSSEFQSKQGGKFGLNAGVFITNLSHNPHAGKDGAPLDAFDIEVQVKDRTYRNRFFDITTIYDREEGAAREPDMNNPADVAQFTKDVRQVQGVITHAVKALGVTQDQIETAFSNSPANNFIEWGKIMMSLVPDGYESKPVDVFLEYQWSIKEGNDRTYLQMPKNMKGGYFLCPAVTPDGSWSEDRSGDGTLRYIDNNGAEHPFTRSSSYMEGPKANQQGGDGDDAAKGSAIAGGEKKKVSW